MTMIGWGFSTRSTRDGKNKWDLQISAEGIIMILPEKNWSLLNNAE